MTSGSGSRACIIAFTIADTENHSRVEMSVRINSFYKKLIKEKKMFCKKSFFVKQSQYKKLWASFLSFPCNLKIVFINGILLLKLFWPTLRKNCSSDQEKLLKFEAKGWEFTKFWDH